VKKETYNYVIAAVYLTIVAAAVVLIVTKEWFELLYFAVFCLAGYGAIKLLDQTEVGRKILELAITIPVGLFLTYVAVGVFSSFTIFPLGALLSWWPWFYVKNNPVYGSEIFEYRGMAIFLLFIIVFWGAVTISVIIAWKRSRY